ncbi:serine protease [Leptospira yasudae]|uniref:S1C family serine protease n=1 Tax=Leptospira yasudae TaxID=2202201 RepID=UPI000E5992B4|nr:trypsin-like peptidase domain-containing protein [Leptospira yasudae]RHX90320.1 serine protease [Leptospira yasudae]TGK26831.1 PDZ domain-containing protein [Leptospira yasudae]TGM04752.1 PDZ domain-containing protein [Leptospira yasudae]TGM95437.1 PDZ domain-containing protein [Leptospira yasudae]
MEFLRSLPKVVVINGILFTVLIVVLIFPKDCSLSSLFSGKRPISPGEQKSAIEIQNSFRNVYHLVKDSVVSIRTKKSESISSPYHYFDFRNERLASFGSGFFVHEKGYIVTNYHVIEGAESIEVITSNGSVHSAKYVGSHERADIALLKIREGSGLKPIVFGDSDQIEVGDWAIAIGSPFGLERSFSVGVVSAKYREDLDETGQTHIQTDSMINPGSSGGPLLNIYGEVIGINRLIRSETGRNSGIGFAIPSNYALKIIRMIESNQGRHIRPAILGVMATVPLPDHRIALGIPESWTGVLVYDMDPQSSAELGGIKRYDFILEANGTPIKNINDLREQVGIVGLGGKIKLRIYREKAMLELPVKLIQK